MQLNAELKATGSIPEVSRLAVNVWFSLGYKRILLTVSHPGLHLNLQHPLLRHQPVVDTPLLSRIVW